MALFSMLRTTFDGMWTHADVVLIVPRQNGKTLIVILRVLYGLFVLHERIVYTAQRWKSAEDAHNRLWEIIRRRPSLMKRVVRHTISQGNGYIELNTGGKILFCTRSADAGRGLDEVDLIIYDESYNLTEAETSALNPTQLASRNPQTIYTSSPVNQDQHPNGYVLAGLRDQGLAGAEGMLFIEYMAPEDMPRDAELTWQYANPSYGVIQTAAKVRKLMRTATTAAGRKAFDVEVLGRGDYPVAPENLPALIPAEVWSPMGDDPVAHLAGPIAVAVDMTPDRSTISIAAAQWSTEGLVHVELGHHGPRTPQAVEYIVGVITRMDPCVLVIDRASPAASMEEDLIAAGIEPTMTDSGQLAKATGDFYDKATAGLLHHTGDPVLAEAVEGAVKRDLTGGGWAWTRKGQNDISPVVAATLAHWGLLAFGAQTAPVQQIVHRAASAAAVPRHQFRGETSSLAAVGF
ncbi:hypothetical protein [Nocardia tengchongensis]|uniref:hypothetical protein n=1 Tax=Nocardia tengchongensis TaxID=2055889 RepID=UPI0036501FCE